MELSEREKEMLAEAVGRRQRTRARLPRRSRVAKVVLNPSLWITVLGLIPVVLALFVLYAGAQVEAFLGDSTDYFVQHASDQDFQEAARQVGLPFIPELLKAYRYRWTAVAGVTVVCVLAIAGVMALDYHRFRKVSGGGEP